MNVSRIFEMIDLIAPFSIQAEGDNSGFLVGSADQEVTAILFALDLTQPVIDEAVSLGAQLIVTHHPLMFSPIQRLTDDVYESRLIRRLTRENISFIAAHTNLDQAPGGVNDTLSEQCGLTGITGEAFFRCGLLPEPITAWEFADQLKERLRTDVRLMGPGNAVIRKVGLCSGGGSSEWTHAAETGCDAFISGEIKHHHALAMADRGIVGLECGHFATEEPGIRALAHALQKQFDQVQCHLSVYVSKEAAYAFPRHP